MAHRLLTRRDIAEKLDKTLEFTEEYAPYANIAPHELDAGKRVQATIETIAASFNDDELMYLQYRRHVECHPLQTHYRLRFSGKRFEDTVHHRLLDRATTIEDADAAFVRLFRKYNLSEDKIAFDFARRILPPMQELEEVSRAWFGPRPPKL